MSKGKQEKLKIIERDIQSQWEEKKIFDMKVDQTKEKFFLTFPYPYMNGYLHLGHLYSMSKCEFYGRYQMMKGKNVLWPFGYHCTGQPIVAAAGRVKEEIERFGVTPQLPPRKKNEGDWQWDIMLKSGLKAEEIPPFKDPQHWIDFFPSNAPQDLKNMGLIIDHRRSFITTELNPYYDHFIQWQFNKLKSLGLLKFGKRMSVYSPKDKQICADHDRSKGEGKKPREYVVIKMKLLAPYPEFFVEKFGKERLDQGLYLGAATLRPETMYGQTNVWLASEGKYGVYETKEKELLLINDVAARNMAHQYIFSEKDEDIGKYENLMGRFIKGKELFGFKVCAPLSVKYHETGVFILPMETIDTKKTTGVVTSVPSDSPDDYMAFKDLSDPKHMKKYPMLKDDLLKDVEIIDIIRTKKLGDRAAEKVCKQLKIKNQFDKKKLEKAHDDTYKEGYYNGIMTVGDFKDEPVKIAKDLIKDKMINEKKAFLYSEPEDQVVSRSGDICVAALTDQWYIRYGKQEWKDKVRKYIENRELFETKNETTRMELLKTVDWLQEWGVSREFGIGTYLPFDKHYLIESLSDSTIYMAFYTIAHFLQGDIYGKTPGLLNRKGDSFNDDFFEYVFCEGSYTEGLKKEFPDEKELKSVREEFEYWYPVDIRCSAKDLLKNHLTFFIFTHVAIWGDESKEPEKNKWPRSVFTNGYINVDGEKMSKSKGNFLLVRGVNEMYPVDSIRIALADAGDTNDDANFAREVVDKSTRKLYNHMNWCTEMKKKFDAGELRKKETETTPLQKFLDIIFENKMKDCLNLCVDSYETMRFRDVLKYGWFELEKCKDFYEKYLGGEKKRENLREDLVDKYLRLITHLMAPIIPHMSEYLYQTIFKNGDKSCSIMNEKMPEKEVVDAEGLEALRNFKYLNSSLHAFRKQRERRFSKIKENGKLKVVVAPEYEDWQILAFEIMKHFYKNSLENTLFQRSIMKEISKYISQNHKEHNRNKGNIIKFIAIKVSEIQKKKEVSHPNSENDDWVIPMFSSELDFDEKEFWSRPYMIPILKDELMCSEVAIAFKSDFDLKQKKFKFVEECLPKSPVIYVE